MGSTRLIAQSAMWSHSCVKLRALAGRRRGQGLGSFPVRVPQRESLPGSGCNLGEQTPQLLPHLASLSSSSSAACSSPRSRSTTRQLQRSSSWAASEVGVGAVGKRGKEDAVAWLGFSCKAPLHHRLHGKHALAQPMLPTPRQPGGAPGPAAPACCAAAPPAGGSGPGGSIGKMSGKCSGRSGLQAGGSAREA